MVKIERIKRAEVEEELRNALEEKEALRSALRIVESENNARASQDQEIERASHSTPAAVSTSTPPPSRPSVV